MSLEYLDSMAFTWMYPGRPIYNMWSLIDGPRSMLIELRVPLLRKCQQTTYLGPIPVNSGHREEHIKFGRWYLETRVYSPKTSILCFLLKKQKVCEKEWSEYFLHREFQLASGDVKT